MPKSPTACVPAPFSAGPKVKRFEQEFAHYAGARNAIAVNSCTAALHTSLAALGVGPGDEVIVPTLTFCSTANVVVHLGATPVIVDVNPDFHLSASKVCEAISHRTKAIVPVHYAGQACSLAEISALAASRGIAVVEDAAHAADRVTGESGSAHTARRSASASMPPRT